MDTNRFKTPDYKRQVHALREHRRPIKRMPSNTLQKVLFAFGLDTWWKNTLGLLALILLVYLVYFASFLQIKNIEVVGADARATQGVVGQFSSFKRHYVYGLPEKNILFFDSSRFKNQLLSNDFDVSEVNSISRKSLRTIEISIVQRVPQFNLQLQQGTYILNSDGVVGTSIQNANPDLLTVSDSADSGIEPGHIFLTRPKADFLDYISKNFSSYTQAQINHFEIPGTASSDLILFTQEGSKIYFDTGSDSKVSIQRLLTIWSGLNPEQRAKISYIDLRFDPRAFLCYQSDPCASEGTANNKK